MTGLKESGGKSWTCSGEGFSLIGRFLFSVVWSSSLTCRRICSSTAETFSLEVQEAEENFDLALVASLEIDVVPHLGGPRVPDSLVSQLGRILQSGASLAMSFFQRTVFIDVSARVVQREPGYCHGW